jgi:DNA-nicking Smr family endonuclease
MRRPRGLTPQDAELWSRVASTVKPLGTKRGLAAYRPHVPDPPVAAASPAAAIKPKGRVPAPLASSAPPAPTARPLDRHGLDASWEKKLARAGIQPDFTLDLHGHNLEAAHARLDHGLAQAATMGARVVLVITGRPRPTEAADRGGQRGAIRAKLLDWLALGPHAGRIAAVRGAHRKHGGAGAVYVILRRSR